MKKILLVVLLFVATITHAQIKFEGVVTDSLNAPLELANVVAINKVTSGLESYGITDAEGNFKLQLGKNGSYTIKISYVGMKGIDDVIATLEEDIVKNYVMQPDNMLDEVELIYEMPVTIKGDTLIYNADSFNTGTERKCC